MDTTDSNVYTRKLWICRLFELIIVAVLICIFSYYFHNPLCGFIFQCGCTFGATSYEGWIHCNIHNVSGPKCPWCHAKKSVVWLIDTRSVDLLMFISYLTVAYYQWKKTDQQRKTKCILSADLMVNDFQSQRKDSIDIKSSYCNFQTNIETIVDTLCCVYFVQFYDGNYILFSNNISLFHVLEERKLRTDCI
eukprot:318335_1